MDSEDLKLSEVKRLLKATLTLNFIALLCLVCLSAHKWSYNTILECLFWNVTVLCFYWFYFDRNHDCFGNSNFASARCQVERYIYVQKYAYAYFFLLLICDSGRIAHFLLHQQIVSCSLLKSFTTIMPMSCDCDTVFENLVFNYQQLECTEWAYIFRLRLKHSEAHRAREVNKCIQNRSAQQ
jgi:hypothetical protein